jgi:hypothetical protein
MAARAAPPQGSLNPEPALTKNQLISLPAWAMLMQCCQSSSLSSLASDVQFA